MQKECYLVYSVAFNYFLFGGSGIMFNKDDLIILVNEYVSAATINLDCIDVCESIVGQLVYLYECVKNQCHLDKVFYDENSISYAFMHWKYCSVKKCCIFWCTNA